MKKSIHLVLVVFLSISPSLAQISPAKETTSSLPTRAEVEASWQRAFGYDSAISWKILSVTPSSLSGMAKVVVSVSNQAPVTAYISQDRQFALVGDLIPFGPDPFAITRKKLEAADGPSRGAESPAILLVEFSDLECPYCKALQPVLQKLLVDFPQIRLIFQHMPAGASVHPWALKAARYADCAARSDKNGFWKYVDAIYENQGGIALATAEEKLRDLAAESGLDAQKIIDCAGAPESEARVKKSSDLGRSVGVDALPSIFINGRKLTAAGYMPYEKLKELVQFEINHAGK